MVGYMSCYIYMSCCLFSVNVTKYLQFLLESVCKASRSSRNHSF